MKSFPPVSALRKPARLLTLLASLSLAWGLDHAQAVAFGNLNVTPRGAQNLNLETGYTELPQGGTATDAKGGLTLNAQKMQLRPGERLVAQNAVLKTRQGGTLNAAQLTYDLKSGTVTATGGVTYSDARIQSLQAPGLVLYVGSGFVVASGGVKAASPAMTGAALVFDPQTMQAVVSGPFDLQTRLGRSAGKAGERLLLTFAGNVLTGATAKPTTDDLARFSAYLK
ncbi:hypothetical protein [uncultured Deinococcus sp.]|uniref:hypothetical protein n=1 Tax=uncultured Deinococcus sp. TaxID=158789 RepID=UPI0025855A50|nr:hypothetical protein [uncultured Deinococcus sp.]